MIHVPVLVEEILEHFKPNKGDKLLDATLGLGGHTKAFLEAINGEGQVVGIDADAKALAVAKLNLQGYANNVTYLEGPFSKLNDLLAGGEIVFSHVLFDLGIGSHQLADNNRGFSFESDGALSMRYSSPRSAQSLQNLPPANLESLNMLEARLKMPPDATEIINQLRVEQLTEVIQVYGDERQARRIAKAIKGAPEQITSGRQLAETIEGAVPRSGKTHPATKTFQALRLAINRELETLAVALPQAVKVLRSGGLIAVISFHSLEDRIVKNFFKNSSELKVVTKRPIVASQREIKTNPRSRSAKLRLAMKM